MDLIVTVFLLLVIGLGSWFAARLVRPKDHDRAEALSVIAHDGAALAVALNPKGGWATLLKQTVDQIADAAGTSSRVAIERAAAGALTALGKNPGVN